MPEIFMEWLYLPKEKLIKGEKIEPQTVTVVWFVVLRLACVS